MASDFTFRAGTLPDEAFVVDAIDGREKLNDLYRFDVTVTTSILDGSLEREVLGRRAALTIRYGDKQRVVHGIVCALEMQGLRTLNGATVAQARMRLVPRAWFLRRRKSSRVFHVRRIDEVVTSVMARAGIPVLFMLKKRLPVREYCTQYAETDWAFVTRLLAEAGIYFFFQQPPPELDGPLESEVGRAITTAVDTLGTAVAQTGLLGSIPGALSAVIPGEVMICADDSIWYPSLDEGTLEEMLTAAGAQGAAALGGLAAQANEMLGKIADVATDVLGTATRPKATKLRFVPDADAAHGADADVVFTFDSREDVRSNAATYREYDPDRPRSSIVAHARASREGGEGIEKIAVDVGGEMGEELAERIGGEVAGEALGSVVHTALGAVQGQFDPAALEIYEHEGRFLFPEWDDAHEEPKRMLRNARRKLRIGSGRSPCPRLVPGRRFELEEHELEHLNGEWVLTEVRHRARARPSAGSSGGTAERSYSNTFVCVPGETTFVPKRPKRRVVQACLTATVVGAQEIHVDEIGRIKVQFHWDREGRRDGESSCWIRVMQPWAGAGWGSQFFPRVGMEVVVGFDGGDPDRPIVLGSVYNAEKRPPFTLPEHKTRSGIRTRSTPASQGHNELSFDDAVGSEQILLRAERDLDVEVMHDRSVHVRNDDHVRVEHHREVNVRGNRTTEVGGVDELTVTGDRTMHVNRRATTVADETMLQVEHDAQSRIGGSERRLVEHDDVANVRGDSIRNTRGHAVEVVGSSDAPKSRTVHVEGTSSMTSTKRLVLSSDQEVVLQCGHSSIHIGPERIAIHAPDIVLVSDSSKIMMGDDIILSSENKIAALANDVVLKASAATLCLGSDAHLDGGTVHLKSAGSAAADLQESQIEPTTIVLVDDQGNPIPDQRYRVILSDGTEQSGMLDGDGRAVVEIEGSARVEFPEVASARPA